MERLVLHHPMLKWHKPQAPTATRNRWMDGRENRSIDKERNEDKLKLGSNHSFPIEKRNGMLCNSVNSPLPKIPPDVGFFI